VNSQVEVLDRDFFYCASMLGAKFDPQVSGFYDRFHFA